MKFFNKDKRMKDYETIYCTLYDTETVQIPIKIQNDTTRTVSKLALSSDYPIQAKLPDTLKPEETSEIKLVLDGEKLWNSNGVPNREIEITWTETKVL